jgi:hypothetical protein
VKCAILHSGRRKRPLLYKIFVNGFYLSLAVTNFFVLVFENILHKATTVMTWHKMTINQVSKNSSILNCQKFYIL